MNEELIKTAMRQIEIFERPSKEISLLLISELELQHRLIEKLIQSNNELLSKHQQLDELSSNE